MRIATYNIENLFFRHERFIKTKDGNQEALACELDELMISPTKKPSDYKRMRELWEALYPQNQRSQKNRTDQEWEWLEFINQSKLEGKAGLGVELLSCCSNSEMILMGTKKVKNKARVIRDVVPDVLILQEVESRISLELFLRLFFENVYPNRIFVPTLDRFGRGMAILCKEGYSILAVKSFTDFKFVESSFKYAAQLYRVSDNYGNRFDIANLHFFDLDCGQKKNPYQVNIIDEIVNWLRMEMYGTAYRTIVGSLNILPHSELLSPFFETLKMVKSNDLDCFNTELDFGSGKDYHALGSYAKGVNLPQKDYLLVEKQLSNKTFEAGMNREGIIPQVNGQWQPCENLSQSDSASGNPFLWLGFNP